MNGRGGDKRTATGRFAGLTTEDESGHAGLFLLGYPATIIRDDETAESLEDGKHLQLAGASLVDRFDARLLLDGSPSRYRVKGRHLKLDKAEEQELDEERYRDLDPARENELKTGSFYLALTSDGGLASGSSGGGAAAAHQRHAAAPSSPPLTVAAEGGLAVSVEEEPYKPLFAVPSNLTAHLPENQRIHRLLVRTARFVAANGDQVEVLLRVRQANNPNFSFLLPGHRTFSYYRWVVESAPRELAPLNAAPGAAPGQGEEEGQQNPHPQVEDAVGGSDGEARDAGHAEAKPAAGAACSPDDRGEAGVSGGSEEEAGAEYGPYLPPRDAPNRSSEQPQRRSCDSSGAPVSPGEDNAAIASGYTQPAAGPHMQAVSAATGPMIPAYGPLLQPPAFPPSLPPHHTHAHALYGAAVQHHYAVYGSAAHQPPPGAAARPSAALGAVLSSDAAATDAAATSQVLPPVTKSIIDKLVLYVAKNGIAFEAVVRKRERANPAFAFLLPWSPHHSYYRRRLEEAVGAEAVASALGSGEGGLGGVGSRSDAGGVGTAASPGAAAEEDTQTHKRGGASALTCWNQTASGMKGASAALGGGEQEQPAPGPVEVPGIGEGQGKEGTAAMAGRATTGSGDGAAPSGPQHAVRKPAQSTAVAGKAVVIRANPKLSTAVPRPPKPPPVATVLASATVDESRVAHQSHGGKPPDSASTPVEDAGRDAAKGDGNEGKGEESQDVVASPHGNAEGATAAPGGRKEPGVAAAETVESAEPSATGVEEGQVIMVFEPLVASESSGSDSDSSSSSEYSASQSGGEEGETSSANGRSGSELSMGDDTRGAHKRRRRHPGATAAAASGPARSVSALGTAAAANARNMDPYAAAAAARLETRRQAARLLLAKAKAQQEVAAAAQRTRAIHHHRHFFLKAADEDDVTTTGAGLAAQHERIPVPAAAVTAALAARSSVPGATELSTTAEADGTGNNPSLAEPLGSAVAAAEVLALERLVIRQKEQQTRLRQQQQEQGHGQERGKQQQEAKAACSGAPDKPCGKAAQPAALSTPASAADVPISAGSLAAQAAASLHVSAVAGGLSAAAVPSVSGLPAKVSGAPASVAAATNRSSLLALQDLVVAAAATAAAHKAAFEAMLRDPSQVIRTDRSKSAGTTTSLGAEPSADRPHGAKPDRRRRRSGEAVPRDDNDYGNGRSRDNHSRHKLRKRSKHSSRSRSRSVSRSRLKPKTRSDSRPRSPSQDGRKAALKPRKDRHRHDHGDRRLRSRSRECERNQPSRERGQGERDAHDRGRQGPSRRGNTNHISSDGSGTDSSRGRSADRRSERSRPRGEMAAGREKSRPRPTALERHTARGKGEAGGGTESLRMGEQGRSSHRSKLGDVNEHAVKVAEAPLLTAERGPVRSISAAAVPDTDAGQMSGDLRTRLRQLLSGDAGLL